MDGQVTQIVRKRTTVYASSWRLKTATEQFKEAAVSVYKRIYYLLPANHVTNFKTLP